MNPVDIWNKAIDMTLAALREGDSSGDHGQSLRDLAEPSAVSRACRELVRAGYADVSPFGYRARQVRQLELGAGAQGGGR